MRLGILAIMVACAFPAQAQYMGTLPPDAEAGFTYTTDSDKFTTSTVFIGGAAESGWGARYTFGQGQGNKASLGTRGVYDSTTNSVTNTQVRPDHLKYTSQTLQLTYVNIGENYDFHAAIGPRQTTAATGVTFGGDSVSVNNTSTEIVGDLNLRLTMTDSLTLGVTAARSVVDSVGNTVINSINNDTLREIGGKSVTSSTLAVDMDLQLTETLSMYKQVGVTHFSNDNNRWFFNTKTTYDIIPEYGVSVYLRGKYQHDNHPSTGECVDTTSQAELSAAKESWFCPVAPYFSPHWRLGLLPGIQIRKPYAGLVYTAAVEYGKQWTNTDSTTVGENAYGWQLGVQTSPGRKTGTTFAVNLLGSNMSPRGGGGDYKWYGLYSWIKVPLQ